MYKMWISWTQIVPSCRLQKHFQCKPATDTCIYYKTSLSQNYATCKCIYKMTL